MKRERIRIRIRSLFTRSNQYDIMVIYIGSKYKPFAVKIKKYCFNVKTKEVKLNIIYLDWIALLEIDTVRGIEK